jgi:hypothetical protein
MCDLCDRWEQPQLRGEGILQMNCERTIPGTMCARDMPTARTAEDFVAPKCFVVRGNGIGFRRMRMATVPTSYLDTELGRKSHDRVGGTPELPYFFSARSYK